jgi:uncharacterized protein (TIGR03435 family)
LEAETIAEAAMKGLAVTVVALGFINALPLRAQQRPEATPLAFEVASVKPSGSGGNGVRGGCHGIDSKYTSGELASAPPLGRCVISDGRLSHLINIAFALRGIGLIQGAPDWVIGGSERFNVEAKVEDPTKATEAQLFAMLQALLIDRFKLKFHRENKDVSGFALVVAKNGPKFKETKSEDVDVDFGPSFKPQPGQPVVLNATRFTMELLASVLSVAGSGPVVDKTGLTGVYDFNLNWDETNGPSIFTAVNEQLGLRLESQKVPVSFFIFESAQRPAAN